jgi:hypothetical protein
MFWTFAGALLAITCARFAACRLANGRQKSYPVLLWIAGMYWFQIAADILGAYINGQAFETGPLGNVNCDSTEGGHQ